MKKWIFACAMGVLLLLSGCKGEAVDTEKSPETIRREAAVMWLPRLKKTVANYDAAIAVQKALLQDAEEKLAAFPMDLQFSDEAKALRDSIDRNRETLLKLEINHRCYDDILQERTK